MAECNAANSDSTSHKVSTDSSIQASSTNGIYDEIESNREDNLKNGSDKCDVKRTKDENSVAQPEISENHSIQKSSLLLRPSALMRDGKSKLILKPPSWSASSSISNKFAYPDESDSSIAPHKTEKIDFPATSTAPGTAVVSLSNPNYIFGQNIKDRVVEDSNCTDANIGNGMLFTSGVIADCKNDGKNDEKESSSLLEDAARCQEQRNSKRKYEEVQVTTGEEDENNILQIVVKLFAFEGGSWIERGRGTLRLNDSGGGNSSRIVIRTLGSLRVILNTKIWGAMELSRASEKSIRTTALDSSGVLRIYLIQASPSDVNTLYDSMNVRIKKCRAQEISQKEDNTNSNTDDIAMKKELEMGAPSPKIPALDT